MNKYLYVLLLLAIHDTSFAQHVEEKYPDTLYCPNDTVYWRHKGFDKLNWVKISTKPQFSPGGNASKDDYVMIYYGKDSVRINYHNRLPYSHRITVYLKSPKGVSKMLPRFDGPDAYFSKEYISKNKNNIQFDIPEPYELANIIWLLSPTGQRATDLYKEGDYYKKVLAWFQPYANHPIFKSLDFPDSVYFEKYYGFREKVLRLILKMARRLRCCSMGLTIM